MLKVVFSLIFSMSPVVFAETKSLTDFNLQIVEISTHAYPLIGKDFDQGFSLGFMNDREQNLGGSIQCFRANSAENYTSYALDYSTIENAADTGVNLVLKPHRISVSEGAHQVCSEILQVSKAAAALVTPSPFPQTVEVPNKVELSIKASTANVAW